MDTRTAVFIGHSDCCDISLEKITPVIEELVQDGVTEFFNGGMGNFDWLCAKAVFELKKKYPNIHSVLVIPYLSFSIREESYFDEILFPEGFEKYHYKAAIPARNRYLVHHADIAICYVNHTWGGAAKSYQRAIDKGLTIINLGTLKTTK